MHTEEDWAPGTVSLYLADNCMTHCSIVHDYLQDPFPIVEPAEPGAPRKDTRVQRQRLTAQALQDAREELFAGEWDSSVQSTPSLVNH